MSQKDGKIIYALIAYENVILCEYSSFTGAFRETCRPYLSKVQVGGQAAIRLEENESILYYLNSNNITYLIMTNTSYQISSAIGCLQSIQKEFEETFPNNNGLKTNKELCLKDQFQDDITKASGLLDERSEKLEVLSVKSEQLKGTSNSYYKSSKRVRRAELIKKIKMYAIIGCSILLIIYIFTIIICGNFTFCI